MIKNLKTYGLLLVIVVALTFLYGFAKDRNDVKKVTLAQVEFVAGDNSFLTHKMVDNLLIQSGQSVKGQLKSSIDLYGLEAKVAQNPYVEAVDVFLSPSGVLTTKVKQRSPIIRVITRNEKFYVDKYRKKVPLSANFSARVPLVSGIHSSSELNEVLTLMEFLVKDPFLSKEVVGIEKNKVDYLLHVRSGSYVINFGSIEDIEIKINKIKAFYNTAIARKTLDDYQVINVKFHNQVVCTKQNQDGKQ